MSKLITTPNDLTKKVLSAITEKNLEKLKTLVAISDQYNDLDNCDDAAIQIDGIFNIKINNTQLTLSLLEIIILQDDDNKDMITYWLDTFPNSIHTLSQWSELKLEDLAGSRPANFVNFSTVNYHNTSYPLTQCALLSLVSLKCDADLLTDLIKRGLFIYSKDTVLTVPVKLKSEEKYIFEDFLNALFTNVKFLQKKSSDMTTCLNRINAYCLILKAFTEKDYEHYILEAFNLDAGFVESIFFDIIDKLNLKAQDICIPETQHLNAVSKEAFVNCIHTMYQHGIRNSRSANENIKGTGLRQLNLVEPLIKHVFFLSNSKQSLSFNGQPVFASDEEKRQFADDYRKIFAETTYGCFKQEKTSTLKRNSSLPDLTMFKKLQPTSNEAPQVNDVDQITGMQILN